MLKQTDRHKGTVDHRRRCGSGESTCTGQNQAHLLRVHGNGTQTQSILVTVLITFLKMNGKSI